MVVHTEIKTGIKFAWDCFTLPEHIVQWNFASPEWHCPSAENDLRTGGKFSYRMEAKDGSFGFDFWGIYDEIIPYIKIAYTLGDNRKVVILFSESNDKVTVKEDFETEKQNPEELQRQGWKAILNNFKQHVEDSQQPVVVEKIIVAPAEKIWKALTDKELMKQWYFDIPDFELKENAVFTFYETGETRQFLHKCKIEKIISGKLFQHTWTHPLHSKGTSLLTWEIEPQADKTKVTLKHEGVENFADAGESFKRENYEIGWNEIMNILKKYLEN